MGRHKEREGEGGRERERRRKDKEGSLKKEKRESKVKRRAKDVMDVNQQQVETRPKQINAKSTRQFTLSMSGELGFNSSMPEELRGSNTGSGW